MERNAKRIVAIVAVAAVATGGVLGVVIFLLLPGAGYYPWSYTDCPGAPGDISPSQIIKIGVLGDMGQPTGDGSYHGAYLAALELNSEGGIDINGTTYYYGITKEDTEEAEALVDTAKGVAAADRIVNYKQVQYVTGGFRTESVLVYANTVMNKHVPFLSTGAALDEFCSVFVNYYYDGGSGYAPWRYYFRNQPLNISMLAKEMAEYILKLVNDDLNGSYPITRFNVIRESHTWNLQALNIFNSTLQNNLIKNLTQGEVLSYSMALDSSAITTAMEGFWDDVILAGGNSITIPLISAVGGLEMMSTYHTKQPNSIVVGIDVPSQQETYWTSSSGNCNYEVTFATTKEGINKTSKTIDMWNNYTTLWGENPIYTAIGSYDAVYLMNHAINTTKSFDPDTMVTTLEGLDGLANAYEGAGAWIAYNAHHDILEGYPLGCGFMVQWGPGSGSGEMTLIPSLWQEGLPFGDIYDIYPKHFAEDNITIPIWF